MYWPRKSYAQMGEDLIIENNLNKYKLSGSTLTYLEIGTNHPCDSSNTFLFYEQGARGILVEPDKYYWDIIAEKRPEDNLVKACVANYNSEEADFYVLTARSLNTLKKSSADFSCQNKLVGKQKIENVIKVPVLHVNRLLGQFAQWPNIISIDTEGLDFDILNAINWNKYKTEIVCAEAGDQKEDIMSLMTKKGYKVIGDNCLNIIFGRKNG
ncbi:MAG: FkbM family methyltransferase [bacterium]|nr:FkbM family methyltransferase [bacterium]